MSNDVNSVALRKAKKVAEDGVKRVGAVRDWLRERISDLEELEQSCDEAHQLLSDAVDALSRLA